jgi:hypothetical protein
MQSPIWRTRKPGLRPSASRRSASSFQDRIALDLIDATIAENARSWGVLSAYKLEKAIDDP